MRKEFKTYDCTILKDGKSYRWKGVTENLYNTIRWKGYCKIRKIEGDKIFIYDYFDNKEYEYTNVGLEKSQIEFKRIFWLF